jgi:CRISPR/Cas system CMR-associated protein Cmr5 small subunit
MQLFSQKNRWYPHRYSGFRGSFPYLILLPEVRVTVVFILSRLQHRWYQVERLPESWACSRGQLA